MHDRRYILWDWRDGDPPRAEDGTFLTSGSLGELRPENVYLSTYAQLLPNEPPLAALAVGEFVTARFSLSGESHVYRIYRVA